MMVNRGPREDCDSLSLDSRLGSLSLATRPLIHIRHYVGISPAEQTPATAPNFDKIYW